MVFPLANFWWTLQGPTFERQVTARDALAAHLAWARRRGGNPRSDAVEDEPAAELDPPGEEDLEQLPDAEPQALDPGQALGRVATAAAELDQAWQEEVLRGPPSHLMFALSGIADRAVFLLEECASDLALRFEGVRDRLMDHSQGGKPMADDALALEVDRLEGLVQAVAARAEEMLSPAEDRDGSKRVWFALARLGCPYTPAGDFPRSGAWTAIPRAKAGAGDVAWWPDYVAVCIPAEGGGKLLVPGMPRLAAVEEQRGPPRIYRLRRGS